MTTETRTATDRELTLTRLIHAPREKVYRVWTDPALFQQWFAPQPYTITVTELDVRAGGVSAGVMRGPDGEEFTFRGVFLEVVPQEKIVFTDAYVAPWEPSERAFMTAIATFEEAGENTNYHVRVLHWSVADREEHEQMGFHTGWNKAADQMEAVIASLD